MERYTTLTGVAAPLPQANIDTDVIMPKQFLKGITREDLARGLFYDLRFNDSGQERGDFILNRPGYRDARFLIVGPNFGCGSSREHAVWGLRQFGIRGILGTSFASIFRDNCFKNGLLPITLKTEELSVVESACSNPQHNILTIDLLGQVVSLLNGGRVPFTIDPLRRDDLLNGRDAVATTLRFEAEIRAFEQCHWLTQPWLKPTSGVA